MPDHVLGHEPLEGHRYPDDGEIGERIAAGYLERELPTVREQRLPRMTRRLAIDGIRRSATAVTIAE